jgi:polyhydroxyalkanoate synthesis regulator phasin
MIDKLKQEAMRQGMKLMSNPKVMKLMADPRLMNAITQGFALKSRIQSEIDSRLRTMAVSLNLATKDDLQTLQRTVRQMETTVQDLRQKVVTHEEDRHGDG